MTMYEASMTRYDQSGWNMYYSAYIRWGSHTFNDRILTKRFEWMYLLINWVVSNMGRYWLYITMELFLG